MILVRPNKCARELRPRAHSAGEQRSAGVCLHLEEQNRRGRRLEHAASPGTGACSGEADSLWKSSVCFRRSRNGDGFDPAHRVTWKVHQIYRLLLMESIACGQSVASPDGENPVFMERHWNLVGAAWKAWGRRRRPGFLCLLHATVTRPSPDWLSCVVFSCRRERVWEDNGGGFQMGNEEEVTRCRSVFTARARLRISVSE
ncbi:uncharacterized protein LOC106985129 isoform X2 [Acinonyx jubatus]|uniref:Uncharacterized protein LOC106985129 isoform X2 n=1 Tax=Acinonyx jubatus TaxID=32536 RepID=A0A6J2AM92_ACIJB|nr:uncharacterized protein LOC106985129 isoform X2 [Acinonyx jubatus]